ncbi:hypothetical protein NFI96_002221 [Prochilodus magdalenae]|nr:hypothetical protein NFI96_002221 [Prochilodus magdalenae]
MLRNARSRPLHPQKPNPKMTTSHPSLSGPPPVTLNRFRQHLPRPKPNPTAHTWSECLLPLNLQKMRKRERARERERERQRERHWTSATPSLANMVPETSAKCISLYCCADQDVQAVVSLQGSGLLSKDSQCSTVGAGLRKLVYGSGMFSSRDSGVCDSRKMAEASISVDQDQFSCPVCLDLLKDPVAIPCGHSYCMVCINGCWDQEDQRGVYSCPQCRETFTPRPVLRRNNVIAEVVEKLKKTELRAAPPAPCYAGPGDVECDFCTGRKLKAVKSCLACVASLCEAHLKPHLEIPALIKHKLVPASSALQEKICSQHDEVIKVYCRTDQSCICYLCTMEEHKGHDTVSAATERTQKQSEVKDMQRKFQQRLQEKEKELQEVKQAVKTLKSSAQAAVEDSERIFTQLIRSIEKKRSEVTELIRAQEKAELSRAEELLEKLEQEIADLKRRDPELEQLEHTEDHIQFLQSFQSLCVSPGSDHSPININQRPSFDGVRKSLSDLKERLEEFWKQEFSKIPPHDYCRLTLDPNTVNQYLTLSEENRVVTCSNTVQSYSDHPERFDYSSQVLSKESVSGRCYWEVEWSSSRGYVYISVSYKGISRKAGGNEGWFGHNSQSWSLQCSPSSLSFWHNNIQTKISAPSSSRIGVYVDHSAGTLSFYSVSDTMTLLHTVHTTFTQPLYAGFWFQYSELRSEVKDMQRKSQQRLQEKEKELQEVKQAVKTLKSSAQAAVEDSERIFTQLIRSIEKKRSEVTELIRAQEKTELSRAEELLEKLEQEIADLKMRDTELEQLEHTEDHIQFLQDFSSLSVEFPSSGSGDSPSITGERIQYIHQHPSFDGVRRSLFELKERLEEFCKQEFRNIPKHNYFRLTLDPNTMKYYLSLSEENRVVTCSYTVQSYSEHPERFDHLFQVLSKESVSGRCYWEVEWSSSRGYVSISVSYKEIRRKGRGNECRFGHNGQSWILRSSPALSFWHNNIQTGISAPSPSRIGVYVDHSAGTLSFYSVSDTMTLLHTVHTTFTQPLYAGFDFENFGSASFQSLRVSPGSDRSPININQHPSFDGVRKSLSDLKERLEEFWKQEFSKIPPHDRDPELCGKARGGGVCVYINTEWCKNAVLVSSPSSTLVEFAIVRARPFYLPRELTTVYIVAVYLAPSANANAALNELYSAISDL